LVVGALTVDELARRCRRPCWRRLSNPGGTFADVLRDDWWLVR